MTLLTTSKKVDKRIKEKGKGNGNGNGKRKMKTHSGPYVVRCSHLNAQEHTLNTNSKITEADLTTTRKPTNTNTPLCLNILRQRAKKISQHHSYVNVAHHIHAYV